MTRILTVLGPKGGVGKTTLAAHLLVAARLDGIDALGLDLDWQGSLAGWAEARRAAGIEPAVTVTPAPFASWREAVPEGREAALLVLDTPPGIDGHDALAALVDLAGAADLALIPAPPRALDLRAIGDLGATLGATFVLNMVERGPDAATARAFLAERGTVCPAPIPRRVDIAREVGPGGTVLDRPGLGGAEDMLEVWRWTADRLGLR